MTEGRQKLDSKRLGMEPCDRAQVKHWLGVYEDPRFIPSTANTETLKVGTKSQLCQFLARCPWQGLILVAFLEWKKEHYTFGPRGLSIE